MTLIKAIWREIKEIRKFLIILKEEIDKRAGIK